MTHKEIDIALAAGHKLTIAQIVVGHRPPKKDPNQIRIAVGGNLISHTKAALHTYSQSHDI